MVSDVVLDATLLYRKPEANTIQILENTKTCKEGDDGLTAYEKYEALREKSGVSNYQVSKDTGISEATLSEWKNNLYTPKLDKIKKLSDYFGVSIEELIGD